MSEQGEQVLYYCHSIVVTCWGGCCFIFLRRLIVIVNDLAGDSGGEVLLALVMFGVKVVKE